MAKRKEVVIAENRDFKGVWVPERIYLTREFTPNEKFVLIEIYSLTKNKSRQCFASNKHFADFVGLKENTIQKMMLKFENAGYIKRVYEYKENSKEIDKRVIILTNKFYQSFINESENPSLYPMENNPCGNGFNSIEGGGEKSTWGMDKKSEISNTSSKCNSDLSDTDLSNTGNSFSSEKEKRNSPKGEQCNSRFSKENQRRTHKNISEYSQEDWEEAENRIPIRAKKIVCDRTKDNVLADNVEKFFVYFLEKHGEHTGQWHYPLTDKVLSRVVNAVTESVIIGRDGYNDIYEPLVSGTDTYSAYREIVDEYFETEFSERCDYSLVHFSSEAVMTNIMNHVGKDVWCTSEIW